MLNLNIFSSIGFLLIFFFFSVACQSLKLLSVMAAIRLDDETDNIESTLTLALVDSPSNAATNRSITNHDPLASSTWEQVTFIAFFHEIYCGIMNRMKN